MVDANAGNSVRAKTHVYMLENSAEDFLPDYKTMDIVRIMKKVATIDR